MNEDELERAAAHQAVLDDFNARIKAAVADIPEGTLQVRHAVEISFDILLDTGRCEPQEFNLARKMLKFLDEEGYGPVLDARPSLQAARLCDFLGGFVGALGLCRRSL